MGGLSSWRQLTNQQHNCAALQAQTAAGSLLAGASPASTARATTWQMARATEHGSGSRGAAPAAPSPQRRRAHYSTPKTALARRYVKRTPERQPLICFRMPTAGSQQLGTWESCNEALGGLALVAAAAVAAAAIDRGAWGGSAGVDARAAVAAAGGVRAVCVGLLAPACAASAVPLSATKTPCTSLVVLSTSSYVPLWQHPPAGRT